MLVLTRGPGQSLVLAEDIVVTVLSTRGSSVRLGIQAPPGVLVRRAELSPGQRAGIGEADPATAVRHADRPA